MIMEAVQQGVRRSASRQARAKIVAGENDYSSGAGYILDRPWHFVNGDENEGDQRKRF